MARIDAVPERGLTARSIYWAARRTTRRILGRDTLTEPVGILAHHPWIARAYGMLELTLLRSRAADVHLRELARLRTGSIVGCPW